MTTPAKTGCSFCNRRGLPILLVRPALTEQQSTLPKIPASISVPEPATGETAYSARLLREGFLYIYDELGRRWIDYYITDKGHYYPLPTEGTVPPRLLSGEMQPCISEPMEWARASLVTLPFLPGPHRNGVFWFGWSAVGWTKAVRQRHENAAYRQAQMQRFDMQKWLSSGQEENCQPITELTQQVAEYSPRAYLANVPKYSPAPWKRKRSKEEVFLLDAAEELLPGRGALLYLQDTTAVMQDISGLMDYRLKREFFQNPAYAREVALQVAIDNLENAVNEELKRELVETEEILNNGFMDARYGSLFADEARKRHDREYEETARRRWEKYEQYYDKAQKQAFDEKFKELLEAYNQRAIGPMTQMYLNLMQGAACRRYFAGNYDPENIESGLAFTQEVMACIVGMQDKEAVKGYFSDLLAGEVTDNSNLLARALVLNQHQLAEKVKAAVAGQVDWGTLPWDSLLSGSKDLLEAHQNSAAGVIGPFLSLIGGHLTQKIVDTATTPQVYQSVVMLGVWSDKAIMTIERVGSKRQFIREAVKQLAIEADLNLKVDGKKLDIYVKREIRKLNMEGVVSDGQAKRRFTLMVDRELVAELKGLPKDEQLKQLAKTLMKPADGEAVQFNNWKGNVQAKVSSAKQAAPFTLGICAGIFQAAAILNTVGFEEKTLSGDLTEAQRRFYASIVGMTSTIFLTMETGITKYKWFPNSKLMNNQLTKKFLEVAGKRLGAVAGAVGVFYDALHGVDEFQKRNFGLSVAYFASATAGFVFIAPLIFSGLVIPGIGFIIATALFIGAAIYIAINGQDNIQKWLEQCLWRRVPAHIPEKKWPAIYPDMQMEMQELKLALGAGE